METFSAVLTLAPHPDSPPAAIGSVVCSVSWQGAGLWCFDYIVEAAPEALRMPAPVAPARAHGLWERSCFELFLRQPGAEDYYEFNFSPSGEWAAFGFDGHRSGMNELAVKTPLVTSTDRRQFELAMARHLTDLGMDPEAASSLAAMQNGGTPEPARNYALSACLEDPAFGGPGPWVAAISAVIEEADGTKSYWALAHPPGEPDFHHPDCFVLDLPPPDFGMKFGIDRLLCEPELRAPLEGRRVAILAHPASVGADLTHSLDALVASGLWVTAAFGPQHGLRGDKQDNMVESEDFTDPVHGVPVFSLYGEVRRPTGQSMGTFDVLLVDLQDLGCRIYTFITTLLYVLEAAAKHGKSVWVLDRPNPAGRPIEGLTLRPGWESFVGAGPLPMRHGLTLGELGRWFVDSMKIDVDYRVVEMEGYDPAAAPGHGWPLGERVWINPSPNAPNLWMARAYAGTVMLEGTTLSEGRGTTRPLEIFGAPDIDGGAVLAEMGRLAPQWLNGCALRECTFEPTFHKHAGKMCSGVHVHAEAPFYDHEAFRPWRLQALAFKAIRNLRPDYDLWRDFAYEYEFGKLAIDVINGGPGLREWVDDPRSAPGDLDALTLPDEKAWLEEREPFLLY